MATFGKKRIGLWNNDVTKIHESKTAWFEQYEYNYRNKPSKNAQKQQQIKGYKNLPTESHYTNRPNERKSDSRHISYAEALIKGIPHHDRRSDDSNGMSDQYSRHNLNAAKHID